MKKTTFSTQKGKAKNEGKLTITEFSQNEWYIPHFKEKEYVITYWLLTNFIIETRDKF